MAVEPPDPPVTLIEQLAQGLGGLHLMLAMGMQAPEMRLSEAESMALAKSVANVGKWYVAVPTNSKTAAWVSLAITSGMIYIPRIMEINRRKMAPPQQEPSQQRSENNPSSVSPEMMQ